MKNKALKRLIYGFSTFVILLLLLSFKQGDPLKRDTVLNDSGFKIKTIIVDAGHGGRRTGAKGSYSLEKNVTLAIAFKLQAAIEKELPNIKVIMTRTNDDDVPFHTRSDIANSNHGDIFISIHCNSLPDRKERELVGHKHGKPVYKYGYVPDRSGRGVLLLVYSTQRIGPQIEALRENEDVEGESDSQAHNPDDPMSVIMLNQFKNKYRKQSIHLADLINNEFTQTDGRASDGVKEQVVFVLDHTAMPSVLVETGFINNPKDEEYLNSDAGQNEIVASIVRAIRNYKDDVEQVAK